MNRVQSGGGGIRTHETRERLLVFKTSAFNRSATHPAFGYGAMSLVFAPDCQVVERAGRNRPTLEQLAEALLDQIDEKNGG